MDENSKRKIDFITITSPIEKKLKNNVKSNFENYRLFDDESGNEQLTKAQDSIQQYIKTFGKIVDDPDAYEISLKKLTNIIDNIKTNSSSFIKTTSFVKFFTSFNDDLIEKANSSSNIAITINNDLLKELQRFSISLKKNDQSNNVQFNRKIQQKINNLTIKLKKINEDIHKYQSRSLTLDEMNDHTVFTKLPRLQKLAIRIWQQRELLLNRSTDTGLQLYRKFVYNGDDNIINHHPQLKQIVENFVNNHLNSLKNAEHELIQQQQSRKLQKRKKDFLQLPMFTILDLKQSILSKLNDEKIDNFQLTDNIVTKIYKNLIEEMTKRHNAQQRECIDNYYLLDYDDNCSNDDETLITNENDPELIEQLEQNSIVSKNAMEKLINEYKKKDLEKNGLFENIFIIGSYLLLITTFPISLLMCFKIVQEYERAVIFRLGKLVGCGTRGPGLFFILPCIDDYSVVDLRTITYDIPPQEVLTKDSVTISVDAVLFYRIWLPTIAVSNVFDYGQATQLLTSVTLRNALGTRTLSEILSDRKKIGTDINSMVDSVTKTWGVKIERVELKDVRLPTSMQRSMAVEAESTREARAKIIAAKGELKASYGLKEASEILSIEPMSFQLRFIQNLGSNSSNKETTVLFPVPMPMMSIPVPTKKS
ncbi:uncharacterized protein LOC113791713 [Dermatophagoides pteronyssinus]|uniref:uncharacterized protein LOC113791713 n=1 Tax=Dermatophagoides pteronyssinus TaxID=6956 RepID=UPI003F6635A1